MGRRDRKKGFKERGLQAASAVMSGGDDNAVSVQHEGMVIRAASADGNM